MKTFKVKFFGSKQRKEQITKQSELVSADSSANVEVELRKKGWVNIHSLKIREA